MYYCSWQRFFAFTGYSRQSFRSCLLIARVYWLIESRDKASISILMENTTVLTRKTPSKFYKSLSKVLPASCFSVCFSITGEFSTIHWELPWSVSNSFVQLFQMEFDLTELNIWNSEDAIWIFSFFFGHYILAIVYHWNQTLFYTYIILGQNEEPKKCINFPFSLYCLYFKGGSI